MPAKKTIKKTSAAKAETKKTSIKKAPARKKVVTATKKTVANKPKKTKKTTVVDTKAVSADSKKTKKSDAVTLPTNMSKRSIEKTEVIKTNLDEYLRLSMYRVAYVSAFCFLLVGSVMALSYSLPAGVSLPQKLTAQLQSTLLTDGATSTDSNLSTTTTDNPDATDPTHSEPTTETEQTEEPAVNIIPDPELSLLKQIPDTIIDSYTFEFKITNARTVTAEIREVNNSRTSELVVNSHSDDLFTVRIPLEKLDIGDYRVKLKVLGLNGTTDSFTTREFEIVKLIGEIEIESTDIDPLEQPTDTTDRDLSLVDQTPDASDTVVPPSVDEPSFESIGPETSEVIKPSLPLGGIVDKSVNQEQTSDEPPIIDSEKEADELILDNSSDLDALIRNYAEALKTGDEDLIAEAKKALTEGQQSIIAAAFDDENSTEANEVKDKLSLKIEGLQKRVEKFETIRSTRTTVDSETDTDTDGITDFDEVNIYGSDPFAADSDNDGVSDAQEVVRGRSPIDDSPEAIIYFESPKQSIGLVREDILILHEVTNVKEVYTENSISHNRVRAEVRGRALPNSFVTLYLFSTPTVVTIRTDADGDFVYTFDKELEDGSHDVYVAVTNGNGEIIAQSNPFSFVKTAEAFGGEENKEVISTNTIVDTNQGTYNVVVGLGILAFGLILLMLGIGLRPKKTTVGITEEELNPDNVQTTYKSERKFDHIDAT